MSDRKITNGTRKLESASIVRRRTRAELQNLAVTLWTGLSGLASAWSWKSPTDIHELFVVISLQLKHESRTVTLHKSVPQIGTAKHLELNNSKKAHRFNHLSPTLITFSVDSRSFAHTTLLAWFESIRTGHSAVT